MGGTVALSSKADAVSLIHGGNKPSTIAFLDRGNPYNGQTIRSTAAGGTHHGVASLAEAFARAGHRVTVYNFTPQEIELNGVRWSRIDQMERVEADIGIAINGVQLLDRIGRGKKIVWFHNPLKIRRLFRQGNLFPVYRHKPHAVFLGPYHQQTASVLLPFSSRRIISYALSSEFVRPAAASAAPVPRVVFSSQPYRGLQWVLDVWAKLIRPAVPSAELHVFAADRQDFRLEDYKGIGVVKRTPIPRAELAQELMAARLLFCPGHPHETYCSAAAEATLAGLPIITRGIGSLAERVHHGENGYIAYDANEFAQHAVKLLADDATWLGMHATTLSCRDLATWDDRVAQWTDAFLN